MKVSVTVRLAEYESLKVESSEHEEGGRCIAEIHELLSRMTNPVVQEFLRTSGVFTGLTEFREPRADGYVGKRTAPGATPAPGNGNGSPAPGGKAGGKESIPPTGKQLALLKRLAGKYPEQYADWMEREGFMSMDALDKRSASRLLDYLLQVERGENR